jgi:hypothetical protein
VQNGRSVYFLRHDSQLAEVTGDRDSGYTASLAVRV